LFAGTHTEASRKASGRSGITNGSPLGLLRGVDMRSMVGRRYKDLVRQIVVDQGGEARIAETRLQLIRRFAAGSCLAEALETRMANGEDIDVEQHCQLSSTLVRLSTRLGLDRHQREVPSLKDYLASQRSIDNEAAE
jgi:hypothetical protein